MGHAVVVATLVPIVLGACGDGSSQTSCANHDSSRRTYTRDYFVEERDLLAALPDGELSEEECAELCRQETLSYLAVRILECEFVERTATDTAGDGGRIACTWSGRSECKGRLHTTVTSRAASRSGIGPWFAAAAHDEAAAVKAFHALARELAAFGAPADLVAGARAAARDEVRHARLLGTVARAHGAAPLAPSFRQVPPRDLVALGVENAREGCTRETFAAFVAHFQALHAAERFRPLFAGLAADETRHAQWSWDLDAWLASVLPRADRRRIERAKADAFAGLAVSRRPPRALGLPSARTAGRMKQRLAAALGAR